VRRRVQPFSRIISLAHLLKRHASDHAVLHPRIVCPRQIAPACRRPSQVVRETQVQSQRGDTRKRMHCLCRRCVLLSLHLSTSPTCLLIVLCALYIPGEANMHRYVIATQSHPLRVHLRAIPGVPIVHVTRSVMVLEPASDTTLQSKQRVRYKILQSPPFLFSYLHLTGRGRCTPAIYVRKGDTGCSHTSGRTCCEKKEAPQRPESSQCKKEGAKGDSSYSGWEGRRRKQEEATGGGRYWRCITRITTQTQTKA